MRLKESDLPILHLLRVLLVHSREFSSASGAQMSIGSNSARLCQGFFYSMIVSASLLPQATAADQVTNVLMDEATLLQLEKPASEIVVGNPSIADVSVQNGKALVITGKSFGQTNLIVIDAAGNVITNRRLVVQEPTPGFVTVYKGSERFTLHCAPTCETPLVIGDSETYFRTLSQEIKTKQSISQSSAEGERQSE
jgi:Pilus formation protein N terminal region